MIEMKISIAFHKKIKKYTNKELLAISNIAKSNIKEYNTLLFELKKRKLIKQIRGKTKWKHMI